MLNNKLIARVVGKSAHNLGDAIVYPTDNMSWPGRSLVVNSLGGPWMFNAVCSYWEIILKFSTTKVKVPILLKK